MIIKSYSDMPVYVPVYMPDFIEKQGICFFSQQIFRLLAKTTISFSNLYSVLPLASQIIIFIMAELARYVSGFFLLYLRMMKKEKTKLLRYAMLHYAIFPTHKRRPFCAAVIPFVKHSSISQDKKVW